MQVGNRRVIHPRQVANLHHVSDRSQSARRDL